MQQNTNETKDKFKNAKIKTRQNPKEQNTKCQNTNVAKYKCNKLHIEQNAKIQKCKFVKMQKYKI